MMKSPMMILYLCPTLSDGWVKEDHMSKFEDDAVNQIRSAINVIQVDEGDVGRRIAELHPTLQQGFARMVVGFLKAISEKDYVDGRNAATKLLAVKLLSGVSDDELYLPLI